MESGSQPASPMGRSQHRFSEIIGVLIALLTLTLPPAIIAYYSNHAGLSQPALQNRLTEVR